LAKRLKELLMQCAEVNKWEIQELSINRDHVHILVQLTPSISVSRAVQYFKGGSSRIIREEFPELEEFLWGDSLWGDGYFVETVGMVNRPLLKPTKVHCYKFLQ